MTKIDDKIDLTILPEEAKRELYDFYLFLLTKYSTKNNTKKEDDDFIMRLIPRRIKDPTTINRESFYAR